MEDFGLFAISQNSFLLKPSNEDGGVAEGEVLFLGTNRSDCRNKAEPLESRAHCLDAQVVQSLVLV